MAEHTPKRVVVLAEPESFFLPYCLARLAELHPLVAIIEVPPPPRRILLGKALQAFGPSVTASIAASGALTRIADGISPHRFYSLRKVARRLKIPYERVSGLHAPDCFDAIGHHRPDVVFTQVSRRVRPELLALATFWNKHCSLLPGYAGVLPVYWALADQQRELGVTIYEMDDEFDRGPILQRASIPAGAHTFFSAYHALYDLAAPLLDRTLRGQVLSPSDLASDVEPSYYSFPTPADRARFRRAGRRFGVPFRLHRPLALTQG
jgi:methionyl-tRNA formyltransferase